MSDCVKIPNFAFGFPGVHGWGRAYAVFMHHVRSLARFFIIKLCVLMTARGSTVFNNSLRTLI